MPANLSRDKPRVATATRNANGCVNSTGNVVAVALVVVAAVVMVAVFSLASSSEPKVQPEQLSVATSAAGRSEGATEHGVDSSAGATTTATTTTSTQSEAVIHPPLEPKQQDQHQPPSPQQHKPPQQEQKQQRQQTPSLQKHKQQRPASSPPAVLPAPPPPIRSPATSAAITRALHELKPDYASRVASAIAAAKWYQPSSQSAAQATLADFLGVSTPTEWPKGGFLSG